MSQGESLVLPGGNEFVGDVTVETGFENGVHDGGIVDFLLVVQFRSPGVSCYVIMANEVLVLPDPTYDVAVHDLHVIDVEKEFEAGRSDLLDHLDAVVDVVAKVTRMALHGMTVVAGV